MLVALLCALLQAFPAAKTIFVGSFRSSDSAKTRASIAILEREVSRMPGYELAKGEDAPRILVGLGSVRADGTDGSLGLDLEDSVALQQGRLLDARQIIIGARGSILGDEIVSLKLIDVPTGRVLSAVTCASSALETGDERALLAYAAHRLLLSDPLVRSRTGLALTMGFGGTFYDSRTSALLGNHGSANVQADLLFDQWAFKLKGSVWTIHLAEDHRFGSVDFAAGDKINPGSGTVALGRVLPVGNRLYATPYAGLNVFSLSYIEGRSGQARTRVPQDLRLGVRHHVRLAAVQASAAGVHGGDCAPGPRRDAQRLRRNRPRSRKSQRVFLLDPGMVRLRLLPP